MSSPTQAQPAPPASDYSGSEISTASTRRRRRRNRNRSSNQLGQIPQGQMMPAQQQQFMQQQQMQQQQQQGGQQGGQQGRQQGGDDKNALSLRLDINLEAELTLTARVHGDVTLALLS